MCNDECFNLTISALIYFLIVQAFWVKLITETRTMSLENKHNKELDFTRRIKSHLGSFCKCQNLFLTIKNIYYFLGMP